MADEHRDISIPGAYQGDENILFHIIPRKIAFSSSMNLIYRCRDKGEKEKMHVPDKGVLMNAATARILVSFIMDEYEKRTGRSLLPASADEGGPHAE